MKENFELGRRYDTLKIPENVIIIIMILVVILFVVAIELFLVSLINVVARKKILKGIEISLKNIFCVSEEITEENYKEYKLQIEVILNESIAKDKVLCDEFKNISDILNYYICNFNGKKAVKSKEDKRLKKNILEFLKIYYEKKDADIWGDLSGTDYVVLKKILNSCSENEKEEREEDVAQIVSELNKKDNLIRMLQQKNKTERHLSIINTGIAIVSLIITIISIVF